MNLKRELIESIDGRIFVGVLCFIAIMILVGWIAINEAARMTAFEGQYLARSIERGATMFNTNCSTCHGIDGRGLTGRAPALNSPYLFGFNYLADVDRQIAALQTEAANSATTDARKAEIETETAALNAERDAIIASLQPAVDKGYNPEEPSRLKNLGWGGTLRSFVETTIISGRPPSESYWPQPMAAWSQTAGGPLRMDQIEDLTNYILNWNIGDAWTVEDANAVNQFPIVPVDPSTVVSSDVQTIGVNTEMPTIMENLATVTGDPQNGQVMYNGALACAGCHMTAAVAPLMEGTMTRVTDIRLQQPENAGMTAEEFLATSITHPNAYVTPGYPASVMPQNFADRLTYQDLADLIAFLETQDQPLPPQ
ncbi:MAG: c-type cytochrome [Anaerolineae bacterium]|nr:c-type cytochrome [Anaerolineae bacterium]